MHDEGTGGVDYFLSNVSSVSNVFLIHLQNTDGGYGIFPLFPLTNCSFTSCPVGIDARKALRAAGADGKHYFVNSDNPKPKLYS